MRREDTGAICAVETLNLAAPEKAWGYIRRVGTIELIQRREEDEPRFIEVLWFSPRFQPPTNRDVSKEIPRVPGAQLVAYHGLVDGLARGRWLEHRDRLGERSAREQVPWRFLVTDGVPAMLTPTIWEYNRVLRREHITPAAEKEQVSFAQYHNAFSSLCARKQRPADTA